MVIRITLRYSARIGEGTALPYSARFCSIALLRTGRMLPCSSNNLRHERPWRGYALYWVSLRLLAVTRQVPATHCERLERHDDPLLRTCEVVSGCTSCRRVAERDGQLRSRSPQPSLNNGFAVVTSTWSTDDASRGRPRLRTSCLAPIWSAESQSTTERLRFQYCARVVFSFFP